MNVAGYIGWSVLPSSTSKLHHETSLIQHIITTTSPFGATFPAQPSLLDTAGLYRYLHPSGLGANSTAYSEPQLHQEGQLSRKSLPTYLHAYVAACLSINSTRRLLLLTTTAQCSTATNLKLGVFLAPPRVHL